MRDSESRTSTRDRHRDRGRDRDKNYERDRDKDRYRRDKDRDYDYYRSKSRSRSSKAKKSKKSKKSKKYSRHSRSSSRSSSRSNSSRDSRSSRSSYGQKTESKSISQSRHHTRAASAESNSRAPNGSAALPTTATIQDIDLNNIKVQKALETIDEDSFAPTSFFSTRDREAPVSQTVTNKVVIDLDAETVKIPKPLEKEHIDDEIIHKNFLGDFEAKSEKWIRKLYNYRQKYINQ